MKDTHVPKFLIRKLFKQVFAFINVQLFNQLLLRRECCSFSNGEYVKTGLAELGNWIHVSTTDYVGDALEELKQIRQAVSFLVIHNVRYAKNETNLCPGGPRPLPPSPPQRSALTPPSFFLFLSLSLSLHVCLSLVNR